LQTGPAFSYDEAFARNIGWVTTSEQDRLRNSRIAIAGLGGVGGSHLITLTRLGIGAFHVADFDAFSLANFNRQAGANVDTLDVPKIEATSAMARAINPTLDLKLFPEGVTTDNIDRFLDGVDLYVDGLDYFAVPIRRAVFARCAELGIPAVTCAPLGMGVALLTFMPGGMTFEEYFRLEGRTPDEQAIRFLLGLSPRLLQRGYLVDATRVNFAERRGPSTIMACELCAGVAATESLKILLRRGPIRSAPHGVHFDAYRQRLVHTWRPWGNANPIQKVMAWLAKRQLARG
jgi:molybdopterin/thiamine biosynthesis adenylyltransferase